ncbi:MAG: hypothetical protein JNL32_00090 [Candidatus Kapabacteria bacterium]|nr:hypothetical protein [Candidatus Kapabacteria bacterium]
MTITAKKPALPHADAFTIATTLLQAIIPYSFNARTAGSLRRGQPVVGDIEIICIPYVEQTESDDLFNSNSQVIRSPSFIKAIQDLRIDGETLVVMRGSYASGRYVRLYHSRIDFDLFMPEAHDYYRQLAIRTGSADYSRSVIAAAWVAKGWRGTADGLRLESQCKLVAENQWKCIHAHPELPPVWGSEEEFFAWLGIPYLHPSQRYVPQPEWKRLGNTKSF